MFSDPSWVVHRTRQTAPATGNRAGAASVDGRSASTARTSRYRPAKLLAIRKDRVAGAHLERDCLARVRRSPGSHRAPSGARRLRSGSAGSRPSAIPIRTPTSVVTPSRHAGNESAAFSARQGPATTETARGRRCCRSVHARVAGVPACVVAVRRVGPRPDVRHRRRTVRVVSQRPTPR